MPLERVKDVLAASDPAVRDETIAEHLRGMERQLEQTQGAVASLRQLLEGGGSAPSDVAFRTPAATSVLLASAWVAWDEVFEWLPDTLADLQRRLGPDADLRGGPDGALYAAELFESHIGEVTAFIPLRELDRTYAALGSFVAEQGLASHTRTAIRENYLVSRFDTDDERGLVTEVCWPVLSTRGDEES